MKVLTCLKLAIIFCVTIAAPVRGQHKHTPSLEDSLQLQIVNSPRISPDGRFIAYRVRQTDWKENAYVWQIWLLDVGRGTRIQLTRGNKSSDMPEWSPDGRWLAFVTERDSSASMPSPANSDDDKKEDEPETGKGASRQIWLISPVGGEAWQLTEHETSISGFHWSKDSKQIAFTAPAAEGKADRARKENYGDYEVFEKDFKQDQLWIVDEAASESSLSPSKARQLTRDLAFNVKTIAWSPDSTRITFSATTNPLPFNEDEELYVVDLAHGNSIAKIVALDGPNRNPVFSPDGGKIAFTTALGQPYPIYATSHIAVVDLHRALAHAATSPAEVEDLTSQFDETPYPFDWGPEGIYFLALQKTYAHIFRVNPQSREIVRITSPDNWVLDDASFTKDFKTAAFAARDAEHMDEIFVSPVSRFSPRKLTDMTAQVKDWILGSVELVSWKSTDGTTIEGVLRKPADYDPQKKYPLLLMIHGGPQGVSQPTLSPAADMYYPVQTFLSKGALVLEPNYRGSGGYGGAFRSLNVQNFGVGEMWDVMSGVDSLIERGIVDPARLGAMGWSYGGNISAFLLTHTDRFKAISVGAGVSNWSTYYVGSDNTPFTREYLHATPWDDPAIYAKTSPITAIKQAKTPTLIQQGGNDKRVPVASSLELYRGLQDQHVPSRLILYTGLGHLIETPKSNRALLQANLDWFSNYIWGEAFPKISPLLGSSESELSK